MEIDPPKKLPLQQLPDDPLFPRLGIRHWLLWTLLTAVIFAGLQAFPDHLEVGLQSRRPPPLNFLSASLLAGAATVAFDIAGVMFARRSILGLLAGHWITVNLAFSGLLIDVIVRVNSLSNLMPFAFLLTKIFVAVISTTAAVVGRQNKAWRAYFVAVTLQTLFSLLFNLWFLRYTAPESFQAWANVFSGISVLVYSIYFFACAVDVFARPRQNWAHWVGAALPLLYGVEYWLEQWLFFGSRR